MMTPIETQVRLWATFNRAEKVPDYLAKKPIRSQIIEILKHRILTLSHTPSFQGKAMMVSIAEKTKARFENLSNCKDEILYKIIKEETPQLLYLYSESTRFKHKRDHLMTIITTAYNV